MNKEKLKNKESVNKNNKLNIYKLLRNLLSLISWIFIVLIIIASIGTIFNSYGIYKCRYFNNYLVLELTMLLGFFTWGIKFQVYSYRYPTYKNYSILSFIFGFIQLVFLINNVY